MEQPQDEEWEHAFGVVPEEVSPDSETWVRAISLEPEPNEEVRVSWDLLGDSVRFRCKQGGVARLNLYREGVMRLSIPIENRKATSLRVQHRQDGLEGVIFVEVWPHFTLTDTLLRAR